MTILVLFEKILNNEHNLKSYLQTRLQIVLISKQFHSRFSNDYLRMKDICVLKILNTLIKMTDVSWRCFPRADNLFKAINQLCLRWELQLCQIDSYTFNSFEEWFEMNKIDPQFWSFDKLLPSFKNWKDQVNGKQVFVSCLWGIIPAKFILANYLTGFYRIKSITCIGDLPPLSNTQRVYYQNPLSFETRNRALQKLQNWVIRLESIQKKMKPFLKQFVRIGKHKINWILNSFPDWRESLWLVPPATLALKCTFHCAFFPKYVNALTLTITDYKNHTIDCDSEIEAFKHIIPSSINNKNWIDCEEGIDKFNDTDISMMISIWKQENLKTENCD